MHSAVFQYDSLLHLVKAQIYLQYLLPNLIIVM